MVFNGELWYWLCDSATRELRINYVTAFVTNVLPDYEGVHV
jgi:hypothetical protein